MYKTQHEKFVIESEVSAFKENDNYYYNIEKKLKYKNSNSFIINDNNATSIHDAVAQAIKIH
jgi:hypothetical protein